MKSSPQFRKNIVSSDWVVVAPKRNIRPDQFKRKEKRRTSPKSKCPFENPQAFGNGEPLFIHRDQKDWSIQVIPNKFPALAIGNKCPKISTHGPYEIAEGIGHHELVITRDHLKNFANLSTEQAREVFDTFQQRYKVLASDDCMKYVFIFHNWGPRAGASIFHPHYQILSLPIIPPNVHRSLHGSHRYFSENKKCVHCVILDHELKDKKRIVVENKYAVAHVPFAAREPFELKIFPKKHLPYFEDTDGETLAGFVEVLQKSLMKLEKHLDVDYNFFIHTAPANEKEKYGHYHWHLEVVPKFSISAGVEIGTGIEITTIDPDDAAKILRQK